MMMRISNTIQGLKPATMMVVVQAALAGANIFYKLAANIGMSLRVLIAYRFIFAAAFIAPLALVVERWTTVYKRMYNNLKYFVVKPFDDEGEGGNKGSGEYEAVGD